MKKRGLLWLGIAGLMSGMLALGSGVQLARDVPAIDVRFSAPALTALPGEVPKFAWPTVGQAVLDVEGVGRVGTFGEQKATPIGSVAKAMTAYALLLKHPLTAGDGGPKITMTQADVDDFRSRIPSGQSLVEVKVGQVFTLRQALEALMLPSANNIAETLGRFHSGSSGAFLQYLNTLSTEMGMKNTRYADAAGFDPNTVSSAEDQVILAEKAMAIPAFAEISAQKSARLPGTGNVRNYNDLLGVEGVIGIKTGSTDQAGGNLLFASRYDVGDKTVTVYGAVFNQPGKDTPAQLAATNAVVKRLLASLREVLKVFTVVTPDADLGSATTSWKKTSRVRLAKPVEILGWPGMQVKISTRITARGVKVDAGQQLGVLSVATGAATVTADLHAESAITEPTVWWRLTRVS